MPVAKQLNWDHSNHKRGVTQSHNARKYQTLGNTSLYALNRLWLPSNGTAAYIDRFMH